MSTPAEICEDGKRQDREDERRARLQRRAHPVGSHSLEPLEPCEAEGCVEGHVDCTHDQGCCKPGGCPGWECPGCLGTGVQP